MPAKRVSARIKREQVIARARGYCEYCQSPDSVSSGPFSLDHIMPKVRGGKATLKNLAYACEGCNGKKRDKITAIDPLTLKRVGLFHPRKQKWTEHFVWNRDFTQIIGRTPIGRATVIALDLNRPGAINLRRLLRKTKLHPPQD